MEMHLEKTSAKWRPFRLRSLDFASKQSDSVLSGLLLWCAAVALRTFSRQWPLGCWRPGWSACYSRPSACGWAVRCYCVLPRSVLTCPWYTWCLDASCGCWPILLIHMDADMSLALMCTGRNWEFTLGEYLCGARESSSLAKNRTLDRIFWSRGWIVGLSIRCAQRTANAMHDKLMPWYRPVSYWFCHYSIMSLT